MSKNILVASIITSLSFAAMPAFAATTTNATQISCVATAVNIREQAIDSAMTQFTQSLNAAYSARATALGQAYVTTPGNGAIKNAIKAAWSSFNASSKQARTTWQSSRTSAWNAFRASVKACKAPAVATDTANASSEHSGN